MASDDLTLLILAAGKGTRMRSDRPKVLHPLGGQPLIAHVLDAGAALSARGAVAVLAPDSAEIGPYLEKAPYPIRVAIQDPPLGTGHAVRCALDLLPGHGTALIVYGDTPLMRPQTLLDLVQARVAADAAVAVLGMRPPETQGYGRLAFDNGELVAIVEARHADPVLLRVGLCNSGVMAVDASRLRELVEALEVHADRNEYYLTEIVALAHQRGWRCTATEGPWEDGIGINSQVQLAEAETILQNRLRRVALDNGVIMRAPDTVHLSVDTRLAAGCEIEPYVVFGPGVTVGEGACIHSFSYLERSDVRNGAQVGPFARLRPGARIHEGAKVGNFVEIKNADILAGTKVSHLSYVGDAAVGPRANVGAGTITCNYDGFGKFRTEIGEDASIGANSSLVAPVRIGNGAMTAAGSTITSDVEDDALGHSRTEQQTVPQAAARFRAKRAAGKRNP
ncbi:bifunctional UDP-N-acetylglucosamine diphosphorylase/glucosamine-1-phosphate N-acetyltransferase GlmU [Marinivivus vitaminiproducens]|uniref:bifunctional UDP-N-acetylglucosamine diphosphorylase/glucosamine-1-phosphate N-acetyltransferase GlmU n=1 Tax=Marinivivus vitaminiproducens TaxID=3035935 RepID=UPI00279C9E05|nr:bifunctional UDP-N-acetylglucosamine diphosphorylase/glucosamine-1-phosphate N-acetyltransferase GlmU [Geminicoccaceae bacterium SCSIO 64248]